MAKKIYSDDIYGSLLKNYSRKGMNHARVLLSKAAEKTEKESIRFSMGGGVPIPLAAAAGLILLVFIAILADIYLKPLSYDITLTDAEGESTIITSRSLITTLEQSAYHLDTPREKIDLLPGSRLLISSAFILAENTAPVLRLQQGAVYIRHTPDTPEQFRLMTPLGTIQVTGTEFIAQLVNLSFEDMDTEARGLKLLCREGSLLFIPRGGREEFAVEAGESFTYIPEKLREEIPVFGETASIPDNHGIRSLEDDEFDSILKKYQPNSAKTEKHKSSTFDSSENPSGDSTSDEKGTFGAPAEPDVEKRDTSEEPAETAESETNAGKEQQAVITELWQVQLDGIPEIFSAGSSGIFLQTGNYLQWYSLQGVSTGSVTYPGEIISSASEGSNAYIYSGTSVICFSSKGKQLWTAETGPLAFTHISAAENKVLIPSADGNLYILDGETGSLLAVIEAGTGLYGTAALRGDVVLFTTLAKEIVMYNWIDNNEVWRHSTETDLISSTSYLPKDHDTAVVITDKGSMLFLDRDTGEITGEYGGESSFHGEPVFQKGFVHFTGSNGGSLPYPEDGTKRNITGLIESPDIPLVQGEKGTLYLSGEFLVLLDPGGNRIDEQKIKFLSFRTTGNFVAGFDDQQILRVYILE